MAVSTGIAMEVHYCMGKLAGVEYFGNEDEKCGKCGMKEVGKNGCCHDEHKFIKLEDSHKNVFNNLDFTTIEVAIINTLPIFDWHVQKNRTQLVVANHSPPIYNKPSVCIVNCTFRI